MAGGISALHYGELLLTSHLMRRPSPADAVQLDHPADAAFDMALDPVWLLD